MLSLPTAILNMNFSVVNLTDVFPSSSGIEYFIEYTIERESTGNEEDRDSECVICKSWMRFAYYTPLLLSCALWSGQQLSLSSCRRYFPHAHRHLSGFCAITQSPELFFLYDTDFLWIWWTFAKCILCLLFFLLL